MPAGKPNAMPAGKPLAGIVTALLLTWACTGDSTTPDASLTDEEVLEISTRMGELILSGLSELQVPDPAIVGAGADIPCDGGTVNLRFGMPEIRDAGRSISFDYEAKPDGCVLSGENIVVWGDPSISGAVALSFSDELEEMAGQIALAGRFRFTAVNDGRTGSCDIDLVESSEGLGATISWKGTVCGIGIDHTEQRS